MGKLYEITISVSIQFSWIDQFLILLEDCQAEKKKAAERDSCEIFWKVLVLSTVWLGKGGMSAGKELVQGGVGRLDQASSQTLELLTNVNGGRIILTQQRTTTEEFIC